MLMDGMLYGAPQTRLMDARGSSLLRKDEEDSWWVLDVCRDSTESDVQRLDVRPPQLQSVLESVDAWRERNVGRGEAVEVDAQLRRSLEALGYLD
jgi:hypothetical protein